MKTIQFHLLFWLFIGLYIFDYFIVDFTLLESVCYSVFELLLYVSEFYIHLFLLLPLLLTKQRKFQYFLFLPGLFVLIFSVYSLSGLDKVLLSDTFSRASISFILNHALFYFISYLVWFFDRYQKAKEQTWKLEKEKLELKMLFLKSQISPHFFFNTLNNIYALSLVKSDKAPQLIALLSDLMRYFVYDGNQVSVSIKEEIKVLEKYLEIQKIRELKGGDHITFHCASIDESIKIPPLLLITLLENAFKHGDINENEKGYVRVSLHDENTGQLHFLVENSFVENNQKAGIGLTNFKSQLDLLFGKNYEFQIEKKDNCYTSSLIIYGFEK